MRFVDDQPSPRTGQRRRCQPLQADDGIEDVVVVAHHDVRPRRRLQGELERTHRRTPRHLLHVLAPAQAPRQQLAPGRRRAVEVAPRIAARIRLARRARVEADALLGRDRHAGQPVGANTRQRLLGSLLPGAPRRQKHEPVKRPLAHRLQCREHASHRLPRTRRRLHQPIRPIAEAAVDALGQLPLVRMEVGIGEIQPPQLLVAHREPRRHGIQPRDVEAARRLEEGDQVRCLPALVDSVRRRRILRVQVDESQAQLASGLVAKDEHGRVEPQLRQMHGASVAMQRLRVRTGGLHLLHQRRARIPAVDPPSNLQCAEGGSDRMLPHIRLAAILLPAALPGDAFLGKRRGVETRMQVAAPMHELGQRLHACLERRHHPFRKRSTRTGRPRSSSASIHSR